MKEEKANSGLIKIKKYVPFEKYLKHISTSPYSLGKENRKYIIQKKNLYLYSTYQGIAEFFKIYLIVTNDFSTLRKYKNTDEINLNNVKEILVLDIAEVDKKLKIIRTYHYNNVSLSMSIKNFFKEIDYNDILFITEISKQLQHIQKMIHNMLKK